MQNHLLFLGNLYLEYPRHGTKADIDVFWDKCADFVRLE
jgi:hypothetical protein